MTTKTLIEAATLTDTGIRDALGTWPPGRKSSQPDYALVADAARDKALWAYQKRLAAGNPILSGSIGPLFDAGWNAAYKAEAEWLADMLTAAGIERPQE